MTIHSVRPVNNDYKGMRTCILCWKLKNTSARSISKHFGAKKCKLQQCDLEYLNFVRQYEQWTCTILECQCNLEFVPADVGYNICKNCAKFVHTNAKWRRLYNESQKVSKPVMCCSCQNNHVKQENDVFCVKCSQYSAIINTLYMINNIDTKVSLFSAELLSTFRISMLSILEQVHRELIKDTIPLEALSVIEILYVVCKAVFDVGKIPWQIKLVDDNNKLYSIQERYNLEESSLVLEYFTFNGTFPAKRIEYSTNGGFSIIAGETNVTDHVISQQSSIASSKQPIIRLLQLFMIIETARTCIGCSYPKFERLLCGDQYIFDKRINDWIGYTDNSITITRQGAYETCCIRSRKCKVLECISTTKNQMCDHCKQLRDILFKRLSRSYTPASISELPLELLSQQQLIVECQRIKRLYGKCIDEFEVERELHMSKCRQLDEDMSSDLFHIIRIAEQQNILPDNDTVRNLFINHLQYGLQHNKRHIRWHPSVIKFCLHIRMQGKKGYEALRSVLNLPTSRTLQDFRSTISEEPGIHKEAIKQKLRQLYDVEEHCIGGLAWDAMKIRDGLLWKEKKNDWDIVGFVDLDELEQLRKMRQQELAISKLEKQKQSADRNTFTIQNQIEKLDKKKNHAVHQIQKYNEKIDRANQHKCANEVKYHKWQQQLREKLESIQRIKRMRTMPSSDVYVSQSEILKYISVCNMSEDARYTYYLRIEHQSDIERMIDRIQKEERMIINRTDYISKVKEKVKGYHFIMNDAINQIHEHHQMLSVKQEESSKLADQLSEIMNNVHISDDSNDQFYEHEDTEIIIPKIEMLDNLSRSAYLEHHSKRMNVVTKEQNMLTSHRKQIATEIMQFHFQSIVTRTAFPLCHIEVHKLKATELLVFVWKLIQTIEECYQELLIELPRLKQPRIVFATFDGDAVNRSFMRLHKRKFYNVHQPNQTMIQSLTTELGDWVTYNDISNNLLFFLPDAPHIVKKLRNNIYKSVNPYVKDKQRELTYKHGLISWSTVKYAWERDQARPIRATKLNAQCVFLNSRTKMSCQYANTIFSKKLIHDIETHDKLLTVNDRTATIWFLTCGYTIKKVFSSKHAITNPNESTITDLHTIATEFIKWREEATKAEHIPTYQTLEDVIIGIQSFVAFVRYALTDPTMKQYGVRQIIPALLNQNIVENHFSAQRRLGGQNTAPSVLQYRINKTHLEMVANINIRANYEQAHSILLETCVKKTVRDRSQSYIPSVKELALEFSKLQPQLGHAAKNIVRWLNNELTEQVWTEDAAMTKTLLYCSGYLLSNLLVSFQSNLDEFDLLHQLVKKKQSTDHSPLHLVDDRFLAFSRSVVIVLHPFLQIETIFTYKSKIFQFAIASVRDNKFIKQQWKTLLLQGCWQLDDDNSATIRIYNRLIFKWVKLWMMDHFKKLEITPVQGKLAHRVQVLVSKVDNDASLVNNITHTVNDDDLGILVDFSD